jgi:quercetin dioxygenase-like cupin family protein
MHSHPGNTYHVFTLLTGELTLTIEGQASLDVKSGDVVELAPGARHTFTNHGKVTATIVEVFGKAQK